MFPLSGSHTHTHTYIPTFSLKATGKHKVLALHTLMCFTYTPLNFHFIFKLYAHFCANYTNNCCRKYKWILVEAM